MQNLNEITETSNPTNINSDSSNISESDTYISEKEQLLKMTYDKLIEQYPDNHISYFMFEKTWDQCEQYMMQVLKYALSMSKSEINDVFDQSQQSEQSEQSE